MLKNLVRKLRFGWPDFMQGSVTRSEYEQRLTREEVERRRIQARLRALEVEYGIPPRIKHK